MKKMKKILTVLMALMLLVTSVSAFAAEETPAPWYELSAENTVLTVRLPANAGTGITWDYEISNPEALELLTMEVVENNPEGLLGGPLTFVASFRAIGDQAAEVSLIMIAKRAGEDEPMFTRVLELATTETNEIAVASILERAPHAEWIEMDENEGIMVVRIPGEGWTFEIVTPEIVELITCEDNEEGLVASFMATMVEAGFGEVVFFSEDGSLQYAVDVFANEGGYLQLLWGETFEIIK